MVYKHPIKPNIDFNIWHLFRGRFFASKVQLDGARRRGYLQAEMIAGNVDGNGVVLGRSKEPVLLREDNQGCMALAKNFMITRRSKHIRVRFHYLRQQVRDSVIRFEYINTKVNTADLFTKVLPKILFNRHRDTMVKKPIYCEELIE